jgi:glucose repression mediator protein
MKDDLPKAYTAYQQALYHLQNPKVSNHAWNRELVLIWQEPKLWYGIGILYDRYGSFEHAEEAFSSVLKMDPSESRLFIQLSVLAHTAEFDKANEIYFRLGIIYKHQRKYSASLEVRTLRLITWPS